MHNVTLRWQYQKAQTTPTDRASMKSKKQSFRSSPKELGENFAQVFLLNTIVDILCRRAATSDKR